LVENSWKKNYDYFIQLFVQIKELYEHTTLIDIIQLSELPYPVFNDIIMKQLDENKNQQKKLEDLKRRNANKPRR